MPKVDPTYKEPYLWNDEIAQAHGDAFDWRCPFCKDSIEGKPYHRAHISPYGTGIGLVPGNVLLTCPSCNNSMQSQHAWEWCERHGIEYQWILPILDRLYTQYYHEDKVRNLRRSQVVSAFRINLKPGDKEKIEAIAVWYSEQGHNLTDNRGAISLSEAMRLLINEKIQSIKKGE